MPRLSNAGSGVRGKSGTSRCGEPWYDIIELVATALFGHAIAVLKVSVEQLTVVDPLVGRLIRTPEDMVGHWSERGVACGVVD